MAAVSHLKCLRIQIFNDRYGLKSQYTSSRLISWRSIKPLLSCPDLMAFNMAAVRQFGLLKL